MWLAVIGFYLLSASLGFWIKDQVGWWPGLLCFVLLIHLYMAVIDNKMQLIKHTTKGTNK